MSEKYILNYIKDKKAEKEKICKEIREKGIESIDKMLPPKPTLVEYSIYRYGMNEKM